MVLHGLTSLDLMVLVACIVWSMRRHSPRRVNIHQRKKHMPLRVQYNAVRAHLETNATLDPVRILQHRPHHASPYPLG